MSEKKQGSTTSESAFNMWQNFQPFNGQNQTLEPYIRLTKTQQQQFLDISRAGINCLEKIYEAGWSGDVKQAWETCLEANKGLLKTYQDSMQEQAKERYELWQNLVPSRSGFGFMGNRS
ncbi:MAG: hypothetical protein CSYNP_01645 [Syntrophus sp. SKADARSKE-3]|nr:hypothetical protein [Syntrophus sp. SKADARSKE-3]